MSLWTWNAVTEPNDRTNRNLPRTQRGGAAGNPNVAPVPTIGTIRLPIKEIMIESSIEALDRAITVLEHPSGTGNEYLFGHIEPLFFLLTRHHPVYVRLFDRAIEMMKSAEDEPETAFAGIQTLLSELTPGRERVYRLTGVLKSTDSDPKTESIKSAAPWIRKINWYFYLGFGGIVRSRLRMGSHTCLYDILQDWRGDFVDYVLLEETEKLRSSLRTQWITLCTTYTQIKLELLRNAGTAPKPQT